MGEMSGVCRASSFPQSVFVWFCFFIKTKEVLRLFGDGLRLSDEPLEGFPAALHLQLLPDHVPAGQVVVVEPVALQEGRKTDAFAPSQPAHRAAGPTCGAHGLGGKEHRTLSPCPGTATPCVLPPWKQTGRAPGLMVKTLPEPSAAHGLQ